MNSTNQSVDGEYLPAAESRAGDTKTNPYVDLVKFLFDGLAAQFPSASFAKFVANGKTMAIWALAFETHKFDKQDVKRVLRYVASNNVPAHEVSMGRVIEIVKGDAQQRAFRQIAVENKSNYAALPKPVDREKVLAYISACRKAIGCHDRNEIKSVPKYAEPADEEWFSKQRETNGDGRAARIARTG